ncbi:MAG: ATP-binding protein [Salinisphaera sp.]|uniref:sensor histidine kinase n=1 Tax=Salinisphaera sp. TaxID=1914330 RepID=UPI003C7B33D2
MPGDVCWPVTVLALHDEAENTLLGFTLTLGAPEKSADRRTAPPVGDEQSAERAWFDAVVHDLREPLRRVREYVETLRYDETVTLGARAADYLGRIDAAVARLQDNVGGILRLARIDTAPFVPERIDLGVLIEAVLDDLEMLVHDHGAAVEIGNLGVVSGDPVQLRLLFQNLIDNSIRYRRPDVPPRIVLTRLETDPGHGMLRLHYVDNARGFEDSAAVLAGRRRDVVAGTGIGLDLCRRIVRRHRGALDIAETHSQGTTFIITFMCPSETGPHQSQETR